MMSPRVPRWTMQMCVVLLAWLVCGEVQAQGVSNPQPDFELSFNGEHVDVASALVYSEGSMLKLELWSEARSCRSLKRDSLTIRGKPKYVAFRIVEHLAEDGSTTELISRLSASSGELDIQVVPGAYSKAFEAGAFERGERGDETFKGRLNVAVTERSTFTMDAVEIVARGAFTAHDCGSAYASQGLPDTEWTVAGRAFPLAGATLELDEGAFRVRFFSAPVDCETRYASDVVLSFRVDPKTYRVSRYELSGSLFRSNVLQGLNVDAQPKLNLVGDPRREEEVYLKLDYEAVVGGYEVGLAGTVPVRVCGY